MIREHVVRACEALWTKQIYQCWMTSVLGISKRRGGAMVGSGQLEQIYTYREQCVVLVDFLFSSGQPTAFTIGEKMAVRMREAFEATAFVLPLMKGLRRGVETWVGVSQALALVELRRSTQPVVDAILHLVRTEQELPLPGGPTGESGALLAKGGESSGGE